MLCGLLVELYRLHLWKMNIALPVGKPFSLLEVNFHYDSPAQVNIMLYHLCILALIPKFTFITTTLLKEYCWLEDYYCMTKHFNVVVSDWERCRYTIC